MSGLVDLDEIVRLWAKDMYERTRGKDLPKLQDVGLTVNWSHVKFISGKPDYAERSKIPRQNGTVLFRSTYLNKTDAPQEHSFRTERTTCSSYTTCVSKGYTKGVNLELKLALPDELVSATTSFGREVTVESTDEETKEETLTWGVDSTIRVRPKYKATAEVVVEEEEFTASFVMRVRIRGRISVAFTNPKDNNALVKLVENDISAVMKYAQEDGKKGFVIQGKNVLWDVEGKCSFRYGIEQNVQLHETPLE
ncbi:uncharacterized protein LOC135467741 [Liolophura sinensis]|uniref:uncharacterized protein LOC135467741 n=1 Tax=Liolophura sinensis TaxID=3198878 RepID=UPI0031590CB6